MDLDEEKVSAQLFNCERKLSTLCEKLSAPRFDVAKPSLANLALTFDIGELCSYTEVRSIGLARKSVDWIKRAAKIFWRATFGTITQHSMNHLRSYVLEKYQSAWSKSKILAFARAFLAYLTKTRLNTRYQAFSIFLDLPRVVKERKSLPIALSPKKT